MLTEIVNRARMFEYMKSGKLDKSSAISRNPLDWYGLGYDSKGRFCLCAIGSQHHLMEKLRKDSGGQHAKSLSDI